MTRQLIPISAELMVEGDGGDGVGAFRGRVLAVALDESPEADGGTDPSQPATWLLVADEQRPAPLWVARESVAAQRLGR
jgi:hypothetical protein